MIDNSTPLEQLKKFLNQLFQFDSQDLDFGVYKILHYKSKEIKGFIDDLLVAKVKEQLQTLSDAQVHELEEQLATLEKEDIIKGWREAEGDEKKTLEKFGKDTIQQYQTLKAKAAATNVSVETENQIYNHLTLFFSRYYDKGDFISKRRFGKNEKYVVPYNGEETHFHWANHNQYYIKSSETFQHYAFKVQTASGNLTVNFKLHNAQLEQGNVKADVPNFFMLSHKAPEIRENSTDELNFILANKAPDMDEHEVTFYFEYRPLDDKEKTKVKSNNRQDTLDELAYDFLKEQFHTNPLLANLWKTEPDSKPLLLKKLRHYTRKNKYDFFIHKNLKGFLERELDYYIKSELINVDDLYVTDTDAHFDRLKHNLKTIKVFKTIADTIIAFVSQLEDFQKKLWEKKKFVLNTEWVITLDRLVAYVGEAAAQPILEEVIKNEQQVAEWKELFGEEIFKDWTKIKLSDLASSREQKQGELDFASSGENAKEWLKLPIDTVHFAPNFKLDLLNVLSEKIGLEEAADGLVIHSDNYHGLSILSESFNQKIQSVYIDPPYNTSASEIIYKNSFKHSSWLSLIQSRLELSTILQKEEGVFCCAIDDFELTALKHLLDISLGEHLFEATVTVRSKPQGRAVPRGFSPNHEYAVFYRVGDLSEIGRLKRDENKKKRYSQSDADGIFTWANFRGTGANSYRNDRPKLFYPVFVSDDGQIFIPDYEWNQKWIPKEIPEGYTEVLPIDSSGTERVWTLGWERAKYEKEELLNAKNVDNNWQIYRKYRPNQEGTVPGTLWIDPKYSASENGTKVVKELFNSTSAFSYPKSVFTVLDSIRVTNFKSNDICLDYFPGSGTTFHATQLLNKEDEGNRKCILIEQGRYVYSIILPRIKKIAYTFDWKDGKPKSATPKDNSMNGLGIFFKYQRLEQYEEALENIAFNATEDAVQMALEFDQYIPKYFLEFETTGSQTLVNTAAMQDPWNYLLKVWDGFTYDTQQAVDLVETFNYLIGLHMQKCMTQEINGQRYQFVIGHNNAGKQIAVVWRSVKDWTLEDYQADAVALKEALAQYTYDLLYINDQAHLEGYQPIEEVFKNKMLG